MEIFITFYLLNLLFHYLFDNTDIILFDFCVDYVDDEWKTVGIQGMIFIQFYFCCRIWLVIYFTFELIWMSGRPFSSIL